MKLTVWDGAQCIGGNKIYLSSGNKNWLLDFGDNIGKRNLYYDAFLISKESATGLYEPFIMNLLPPVKGLYREDLTAPTTVYNYLKEVVRPDGVIVSHAHIDHVGAITYLDIDIPIISSLMSAGLMRASDECSKTGFGIICARKRETNENGLLEAMKTNKTSPPSIFWRKVYTVDETPNNAFEALYNAYPGKRLLDQHVKLQAIERLSDEIIKAYPVDHSIHGACSYALNTDCGWVVYTGDLRFHGTHSAWSKQFVENAAKLEPEVLIIEGTRLNPDHKPNHKNYKEVDILQTAIDLINKEDGLVIADFSMRHLERLAIFSDVAKATNRKLVIKEQDAYLLLFAQSANEQKLYKLPALEDMMVYKSYSSSDNSSAWQDRLNKKLAINQWVKPDEVKKDPKNYLLCMGYFDLKELPYITTEGKRGGLWIRSSSEPFNEEAELDEQRLLRWLDRFNFSFEPQSTDSILHASGHASQEDLFDAVRNIRPKVIIPIHSLAPILYESVAQETGAELWIPDNNNYNFEH